MPAVYQLDTDGDIALSAATAKTIMLIGDSPSATPNFHVSEIGVSFDGVDGSEEPVTVELGSYGFVSGGTFTSKTPIQISGPTRSDLGNIEGRIDYTGEPLSLVVRKRWLIRPNGGTEYFQWPLYKGNMQNNTASSGVFVRCTAPSAVNCQGYMIFEEGGGN